MKKILITGAQSYIGCSLEAWINQNYRDRFTVEELDLRSSKWENWDFSDVDVVIHLAAIVHVNEKNTPIEDYDSVNHKLAVRVAEKAKASGVSHFIFFSTKGVYTPNTPFIDESTIPVPHKKYGISKLAAENDLIVMQSEVFKVSILRPPTVYGEGAKGNFPKLYELSKKIHVFPNIDNNRSMIYIWNLCEFLCLLIENPLDNVILFPQNKEYCGTLKIITSLWNIRNEKYRLSNFLAWIVRVLMRMPKFSKLRTAFCNSVYDRMLSDYYQYEYCVYSFEDSIKRIESTN